jgi:hypothetical protein
LVVEATALGGKAAEQEVVTGAEAEDGGDFAAWVVGALRSPDRDEVDGKGLLWRKGGQGGGRSEGVGESHELHVMGRRPVIDQAYGGEPGGERIRYLEGVIPGSNGDGVDVLGLGRAAGSDRREPEKGSNKGSGGKPGEVYHECAV